jgi:hypothetical protein
MIVPEGQQAVNRVFLGWSGAENLLKMLRFLTCFSRSRIFNSVRLHHLKYLILFGFCPW